MPIGLTMDTWAYAGWIIVTCLILMIAGIILYVAVVYYRRQWLNSGPSSTEPWTLEDLRRLRSQGDLTEEEYQAMRSAVIDAYRGSGSTKEEESPTTDNHFTGR